MPDLTGQDVGRYHIMEKLGEGGMATVYRAYDTNLERDLALKVIRSEEFSPKQAQKMLQRFEREAKALARLVHPNIVRIYDYGDYRGEPYLVMEFAPGGTLKGRMGRPMEARAAAALLAPVARALEYAHEEHLIHRDVKPANILLTKKGQPMLTDFGIAKILDLDEGQTLTGTNVGVGTPQYMAPEQWHGRALPQTDVYALGVVLYEMLTGRLPYQAETPAAILLQQANDPLPPPRQFNAALPEEAERVLYKALAREAQNRYASMGEFAEALERMAAVPAARAEAAKTPEAAEVPATQVDAPVRVTLPPAAETRPDPEPPQTSPRPKGRKRVRWGLLAGGVGLVAVLAILLSGQMIRAALQAPESTRTPERPAATVTIALEPTQTPESSTATDPAKATAAAGVSSCTQIGQTRISEKDGMVQVCVPEGEFQMGSESGNFDEKPVHTVWLDGYWIDRTEVTNAMYALCVADGGCSEPVSKGSDLRGSYYGNSQYAEYPVIWVDWGQANTYCAWAGRRLPTEAEWEKAARGTDGRTYPWGEEAPTCSLANYGDCEGQTKSVGSTPAGASPYGALDMAGNVWEWIADWYGEAYYGSSPLRNPPGPESGETRVARGGSWGYVTRLLRSSLRYRFDPSIRDNLYGFRCLSSP